MNKIEKNYIYNLLYQIFIMIVPIVTTPYLARILGAENLGIFGYVQSVTNIVSTITLLGIFGYANRQIAYDRDNDVKMNETFWEIMVCRFVLGIIGIGIYIILAIYISNYTTYFWINVIWLVGNYIDCTWFYVGIENMKLAVIKNFIAKLISIIGIFVLVKDEGDINIYFFIMGFSILLANLSAYTSLNNYINRPIVKIKNIINHIKGSFQLFLPSLATLIYLQIGKIMIEIFTGETSQVAFYDNSEKIVTIPLSIITVLSTVMMPRIANEFRRGNLDRVEKYLLKAGHVSLFLAFPMTFGLMTIANKFVPWYLGGEFSPVAYSIIIISPIIISNTLAGISGNQYFIATNQIKVLTLAYCSTAIINILLNFILIPSFGFYGCSIATLISSYISVIIQFFFLSKQVEIKKLIFIGFKYCMYSIIMAGGILIITYNYKNSIITTLFQIIIGCLIYFSLCLIFKDEIIIELIKRLKVSVKSIQLYRIKE